MSPVAFETFYFKGTSFDPTTLKAYFRYSFDGHVNFEECIDFSTVKEIERSTIEASVMDNLLFHLSLALGISYYKLSPTKELVVEHGSLNEEQKLFWKKFYIQGL